MLTAPVPYFTGQSAPVWSVAAADLDGDGDQDIVSSNGPRLVVLRNVGAGSFAVEPQVPALSHLYDLACADLDADGRIDVLASGTAVLASGTQVQGRLVVFLNQTTPGALFVTFAAPVEYPFGPQAVAGSNGKALEASDLNRDGIVDVAIADNSGTNAWVLLGQGAFGVGNGTFGAPVPYPLLANSHMDVAIADFNLDGAPDLVLVRYGGTAGSTTAAILAGQLDALGIPTGTFVSVGTVAIPGPSAARGVAAADVNADGFPDFVVANSIDVDVAYGTGAFGFTVTAYPAGNLPLRLTLGDLTGDGLVDIGVARDTTIGAGPGNFTILTGQPGGSFVGYINLAFNEGLPMSITSADFDGDGRLDVAAGRATGRVDVRLGSCPASVPPLAVGLVWPNGGEVLGTGIAAPVAWTKSATVALVDVDVSVTGGATWEPFATALSGTNFSWVVPRPGSGQALVRVRASGIDSVSDASDLPFTIVGAGAASSSGVGAGCAAGGPTPTLAIAPPVLGGSTTVSLQGPPGAYSAAIFLSPVPQVATPVGPGCFVYLDLAGLVPGVELVTDPSGAWSVPVTLPLSPGMTGLAIRAQAVVVLPPPPGYALTNGLQLEFGF